MNTLKGLKNYISRNIRNARFSELSSKKYVPLVKPYFTEANNQVPSSICIFYQLKGTVDPTTQRTEKFVKIVSAALFSSLLVVKLNIIHLPLLANFALQPFILYYIMKCKKKSNLEVKTMCLLKNGEQLMITTKDESSMLVNIKDLIKSTINDKTNEITFNTYDARFVVNLNKSLCSVFVIDILYNVILSKRLIDTSRGTNLHHHIYRESIAKMLKYKHKHIKVEVRDKLLESLISRFPINLFATLRNLNSSCVLHNKTQLIIFKNKLGSIKVFGKSKLYEIMKNYRIHHYVSEKQFMKKTGGLSILKFISLLENNKIDQSALDVPTGRKLRPKKELRMIA